MELSIKQGLMRAWSYSTGNSFKESDSAPQIRPLKSLIAQLKLITLCFQLPGSLNNLGEYPPAFIMNSRANKLGRKGAVDKGDR